MEESGQSIPTTNTSTVTNTVNNPSVRNAGEIRENRLQLQTQHTQQLESQHQDQHLQLKTEKKWRNNSNKFTEIGDFEFNFVSKPSSSLYCAICQDLYNNPVLIPECGHCFCQSCILQSNSDLCPLCRVKINKSNLIVNRPVDELINDLKVYCKFKQSGCESEIPIQDFTLHVSSCLFAPSHCIHSSLGCKWTGTRNTLSNHLKQCTFEEMKEYIKFSQETIAALKTKVEVQALELKELKRLITSSHGPSKKQKNNQTTNKSEQTTEDDSQEPTIENGKTPSPSIPVNIDHVESSAATTTTTNTTDHPAHLEQTNTSETNTNTQTQTHTKEWKINSIICRETISAHRSGISALAVSEQHKIMISASHDAIIRVWDISGILSSDVEPNLLSNSDNCHFPDTFAPKVIGTLEGHSLTVWKLIIAEEATKLYSASADGFIMCWDLKTMKQLQVSSEKSGKIYAAEMSGNYLFSGGSDRLIRVWDRQTLKCVTKLAGHSDPIWSLAVSGDFLYSGSEDTTVRVWDTKTLTCFKTLETTGRGSKVYCLLVTDGFLIIGTDDCKIKIWDSNEYRHIQTFKEHNWEVWQLCYSNGYLFSASFDHSIKIWDLKSAEKRCVRTLLGHSSYIHALAVSNRFIFSGSGDRTIKIWS